MEILLRIIIYLHVDNRFLGAAAESLYFDI